MSRLLDRILCLISSILSAWYAYCLSTHDAPYNAIMFACFALYGIIGAAVWDFRGKK